MPIRILRPYLKPIADWASIVVSVSAIFAATCYIQFEYLVAFNTTPLMAIFFIPAAVRVFSVITVGYWAGLGVALGAFFHDTYLHPMDRQPFELAISALQQGGGVSLSLLIWALTSRKVSGLSKPTINFTAIDAFDVLQMCVIQAVVNSSSAHLFYIWSPTIHHHFDLYYFMIMFIGDLAGAFLIFILSNIVFSLLLRVGIIPRKQLNFSIDQLRAMNGEKNACSDDRVKLKKQIIS